MGAMREGGNDPSRAMNPRYREYDIASRPGTFGNIATAAAGMLPGGGLIQGGIALAKGTPGDPYSGPVGKTKAYDYDGQDRLRLGSAGSSDPAKVATMPTLQDFTKRWDSKPPTPALLTGKKLKEAWAERLRSKQTAMAVPTFEIRKQPFKTKLGI